jgi:predicted alpha/beta hydrolase
MTDSIWSSAPLTVPTSGELGAWEQQDENILALAEAGLYEAATADGKKSVWQRGFDKKNPVDISGLVEQWLGPNPVHIPVYIINRFVGMGLASVTSNPWRHWIKMERKIQPVPMVGTTKRLPLYPIDSTEVIEKEFQPLRLRPADEFVSSYPYSKLTLDPELVLSRLAEEITESAGF